MTVIKTVPRRTLLVVGEEPPPPPPPPGEANLFGLVVDGADKPIAGVSATLDGGEKFTNSSGEFSFVDVAEDVYTLTCKKSGYETKVQSVTLLEGHNYVTVVLKATVFPWKWVAVGGGVIVVIALASEKRKPRKV